MPKHILFPTDFSSSSQAALHKLLEMAQTGHYHVTLVHICDLFGPLTEGISRLSSSEFRSEMQYLLRQEGLQQLETWAAPLRGQGLEVELVCQSGRAAQSIVRLASKQNYDLILMGSHINSLRAWLGSSVSRYVLKHSSTPTLLIQAEPQASLAA